MELANFQTEIDIVLSDIYLGFHMLRRDQQEQRQLAIRLAMMKNNFIRNLAKRQLEPETNAPHHPRRKMQKRVSSVYILERKENSTYEVCERDLLLQTNEEDQKIMQDLAYYSKYAQIIYSRLRTLTVEEFGLGNESTHFTRGSDTLFESRHGLSSLDCEDAMLSYACFLNGIVSTPYSIMVDKSKEKIIIAIRGTISIEDMVVDLQYKPACLEKVGVICGSDLKGHSCHKGFLARSKWLYNSLRSEQVLKTMYSDKSPFKDYGLVVCGHSLGAGCASLLAIMLRPSFPSIRCFAYEPPGGLLDEDLATECEDFIVSTVRQDDMIPRVSHQNFDELRVNFFSILTRIKVPKIQAFHDIRTHCNDASIKHRNSKVLRKQTDVPTDTVFYKRLEQFRLERSEADYVKLYLPGKIVHFLDPGDGRRHIPYYASKHEFDHIAISKTMVSDHSCKDLVGVLQNAQLSGSEGNSMISFTWNDPVELQVEDEVDADNSRLFMLCSNPYGRLPILLTLSALIALIFSILSVSNCEFFTRSSTLYYNGEEVKSFLDNSVGLFSYKLLECGAQNQNCSESDEYTHSPYCIPYIGFLLDQEVFLIQAQIFVACQMGFAFLSLLLLCISTCYRIGRKAWIVICLVLLLSTLFQGLVFVIHKDQFCNKMEQSGMNGDQPYTFVQISICRIGREAAFAIAACCLYFITAVGSMFFASRK